MTEHGIEVEAHSFDHRWGEHSYRQVTVEAKLGDNSSLSITEEYDPSIEDADKVIARCADDLRLLIQRRGRG